MKRILPLLLIAAAVIAADIPTTHVVIIKGDDGKEFRATYRLESVEKLETRYVPLSWTNRMILLTNGFYSRVYTNVTVTNLNAHP